MSNFKIGEKVVCINPKTSVYKKYNEYIITNIRACACGIIELNVNNLTESPNTCECSSCGHITITPLDWNNSNRFRKLDHQFAEDICAQLIADAKKETILN